MNRASTVCGCALLCCATLLACASGTAGELVEIELEVVAEGQGDAPPGHFTTQTGYDVELEEATLSVSSILAYAPDPRAALDLEGLWTSKALAHGGYDPFNGRIVRAEYARDVELDLLSDEPVVLGTLEAETGAMDSVSVLFGEQASGMQAQAFVRGVASREGESVAFEGSLQLEDEALLRRVDGVGVDGSIVAGGTLRLVVRPRLLFDEAHFARLSEGGGGPAQITPNTQVHTTWVFGARSTRTYGAQWRKP